MVGRCARLRINKHFDWLIEHRYLCFQQNPNNYLELQDIIFYHRFEVRPDFLRIMAITILPPAPPIQDVDYDSSSDSGSDGGADLDGDLDMRPKKRARRARSTSIVTPGEVVTDDPQWMR